MEAQTSLIILFSVIVVGFLIIDLGFLNKKVIKLNLNQLYINHYFGLEYL